MFKKYSALFLVLLLSLHQFDALRIKLTPVERSLLPNNSVKDVLTQMVQEAQKTDTANPKTFKEFLDRIKGMLDNLVDEEEKHKAIYEKMMSQCSEEYKFRDKACAVAKDSEERAAEALNKCQESQTLSQITKDEVEILKTGYEGYLKAITDQRKREHKLYLERKADLEEALNFLVDFQTYLNNNFTSKQGGEAFVQMANELLRYTAIVGGQMHETIPIFIAISQVAQADSFTGAGLTAATSSLTASPATGATSTTKSYINADSFDQLLDAVKILYKRINDSLTECEKIESDNLAAFTQFSSMLQSSINQLASMVTTLQNHISAMATCVVDETKIETEAANKLKRNSRLKESAKVMCKKFKTQFIEATKDRKDEVNTLKTILHIIHKRYKKKSLELQYYIDKVDDHLTVYINSTEFKEFQEYKEVHIDDDEKGKKLANEDADSDTD